MHSGHATDECNQDQTDRRPNQFQSLTGGDESDSPTDEKGGAEINHSADAEIENRETVNLDERRTRFRQKDLPTGPQNKTGGEVGRCQGDEWGETEDRPRSPGAPGLELALLDHRFGEVMNPAKPYKRLGFRICPAP